MDKVESGLTVFLCILDIKPILKKAIGFFWPFFILESLGAGNKALKKTHWGGQKSDEAKYAKSLSLMPGIYFALLKRYNREQALDFMKEIIVRLSHTLDYATAKKHYLFTIKDPFERWIKYRSILITEGFGLHNCVEDVYISKERIHYTVSRCIFADVFKEMGAPELTPFICDYDQQYHSAMFKEFYFDRNGDWKNTIGYGASLCHYVWKDKEILTPEFKATLEAGSSGTSGKGERRAQFRRQYDRRQGDRRKFSRRSRSERREQGR